MATDRRPWDGGVDVQGHRGARGLVPESTLASFEAAWACGVGGVELDVRLTADGQVVVWHDAVLDPAKVAAPRGVLGRRVDELTLDELGAVDIGARTLPDFARQRPAAGSALLSLFDLLRHGESVAPGRWWTIELKVDPRDEREAGRRGELLTGVVRAVYAAGVQERCFVHSFDWEVLRLARQSAPELLRSALVESADLPADRRRLVDAVVDLGAQVVAPHHSMVDAALVEAAHAAGIGVLAWTVNEPADAVRLARLGVDAICTDVPDTVIAALGGACPFSREK